VGLIARQIEAAGIPTVSLTSAWSITVGANPPRAAFTDLPLGHTSGAPRDRDGQRLVVGSALEAAASMTRPGSIVDLGVRWIDDEWKAAPLSWRRSSRADRGARSNDTRSARDPEPQYQCDEDRALAQARSYQEQCQVCIGLPTA
jgi:D-proline reductase (dithiol) PrdB